MLRKEIYRALCRSKFCIISIFKNKFDAILNKYGDIRKIIFEHFDNNISMLRKRFHLLKYVSTQHLMINDIIHHYERIQNRHNIKQYGHCKVNITCYQNPYGGMEDIREFYLLGYSQRFNIHDIIKCLDCISSFLKSNMNRKIDSAMIIDVFMKTIFLDTSKKTNIEFISRGLLVNIIDDRICNPTLDV